MGIEPTLKSVLQATQALLRNDLGNAAQSSQAESQRSAVNSTQSAAERSNDQASSFQDRRDETSVPRDTSRGGSLDIDV